MNDAPPTAQTACLAQVKVLQQFGALCWRRGADAIEILLITSSSGNWILPKGRPVPGMDGAGSAAQEAWEEAGARGETGDSLGAFHSAKTDADGTPTVCQVEIFPLKVNDLAKKYPESKRRKRGWVPLAQAPDMVANPDLRAFLKCLDPAKFTV